MKDKEFDADFQITIWDKSDYSKSNNMSLSISGTLDALSRIDISESIQATFLHALAKAAIEDTNDE